jgi:hypothetical protein
VYKIEISRLYYQVGQLVCQGDVVFTTDDGGRLEVADFVNKKSGPKVVEVEGAGKLYVEHSPQTSLSFKVLEMPEGMTAAEGYADD